MPDKNLEWLVDELTKVQDFLRTAEPNKSVTGGPEYLRGLRDMCAWVLQKADHEVEWQGLRSFVADAVPANFLPEHGSSFEVKPQFQWLFSTGHNGRRGWKLAHLVPTAGTTSDDTLRTLCGQCTSGLRLRPATEKDRQCPRCIAAHLAQRRLN